MSALPAQRCVALNVLTGTRGALGVIALLTPKIGAGIFRIDADGSAIVMGRLFGIHNIARAAGLLRLEVTTVPRPFLLVKVLIDLVAGDRPASAAAGRSAPLHGFPPSARRRQGDR
jgi:hypothetical protein